MSCSSPTTFQQSRNKSWVLNAAWPKAYQHKWWCHVIIPQDALPMSWTTHTSTLFQPQGRVLWKQNWAHKVNRTGACTCPKLWCPDNWNSRERLSHHIKKTFAQVRNTQQRYAEDVHSCTETTVSDPQLIYIEHASTFLCGSWKLHSVSKSYLNLIKIQCPSIQSFGTVVCCTFTNLYIPGKILSINPFNAIVIIILKTLNCTRSTCTAQQPAYSNNLHPQYLARILIPIIKTSIPHPVLCAQPQQSLAFSQQGMPLQISSCGFSWLPLTPGGTYPFR